MSRDTVDVPGELEERAEDMEGALSSDERVVCDVLNDMGEVISTCLHGFTSELSFKPIEQRPKLNTFAGP